TEIAKLHNRIGTTSIYVTHDQTEAMTMADRIVVLKDGLVQQIATPQIMYENPNNVFVAGFIGSPAMNFIKARLEKGDGGLVATFGGTRVPISRESVGEAKERGRDPESFAGKEVILGIRPEHIEDAEFAEDGATGGVMEAEPQVIESMGSEKYLYFEVAEDQAAHPRSTEGVADAAGGDADDDEPDFGDLMVARVAAESQARRGTGLRLAIDSTKVRLFDPESEESIL
ncbi:MAG: ABC transporter ATP-binding protein, partial [Rubrobacteraceae bacterium]